MNSASLSSKKLYTLIKSLFTSKEIPQDSFIAKIISVIEPEKCVISSYILYIIIYKFRHMQELCPVVLLSINKGLEVSLYYAILSLYWTICLWIEDYRILACQKIS